MSDHNHDDAAEAALGLLGLSPTNTFPSTLIPLKRKKSPVIIAHSSDDISCICGFSYDDGFSIACDDCSRWCHAACFGIMEGGEVPEEFRCWECVPRTVDKERAVKLQKARLKRVEEQVELDRAKRRTSPGVEKKPRRASTAAASAPALEPEPWSLSYVHIPRDIIPHDDTREKLRRQAQHWRGITALDDDQPSSSSSSSRTTLRPLPPSSFSNPALSLCSNPSVRPPSYVVHTSTSIPSEHLITPYKSTITPSSSYLSDPLNSYAHLGMPKPFVHLLGHPLDLALDSRITGNGARFVRNGCRPNAVLRPFLCPQSNKPPEALSFGIFALRDLKANEEVVLGWEWDDGHVVHNLPALVETPHAFPGAASPGDTKSPEKLHHIRNQMSNILHALSSTFTTCACGARAKNCAITQMAAFVDGEIVQSAVGKHLDLGPLVGATRGFRTRERVPFSGGLSGVELCGGEGDSQTNNLSPPHLVLSPASDDDLTTSRVNVTEDSPSPIPSSGAGGTLRACSPTHSTHVFQDLGGVEPVGMDVDHQVPCEDKMPPKMRKKWIQREYEVLRESGTRCSESPSESGICASVIGAGLRLESDMDVDDSHAMPPPPTPSPKTLGALPAASPSASFAQLSLVSPIILNAPGPLLARSPSLDPLSTVLNLPSHAAVHEQDLSMTCTDRSTVPKSPSVPREGEISSEFDTKPPSEPPPLPESLPANQATESALSAAEEMEMVSRQSLGDAPPSPSTTIVVPTSPPPPASREEAKEEEAPVLASAVVAEEQPGSEAIASDQRDLLYASMAPPSSTADTPHAAQKVKMSLKDFAIRKRKQREEEQARSAVATEPAERIDVELTTPNDEVLVVDSEADGERIEVDEEGEDGHDHCAEEVVEIQCHVIESCQERDYTVESQSSSTIPNGASPPTESLHSYTRQAKQELIDPPLLPVPDSTPPTHKNFQICNLTNPTQSPPQPPRRQPSHEDGEISNGNDYVPFLKRVSEPLSQQHLSRSHTPPTQPRSFNASPHTQSPSPSNSPVGPTSISRRPSLPPYRAPLSPYSPSPSPAGTTQSATIAPSSSGRPLPSGPRALRTVNLPLNNSYRPYSGSQYVPRGPSADRDRLDWERERTWQRTRVRGPGWGR